MFPPPVSKKVIMNRLEVAGDLIGKMNLHNNLKDLQRACYAEDGSIPAVVHTRTKEVDGSTKSVMMLEKIHKDQDKSRHKHQHLSAALNRVEEKINKAAKKGG